MKDNDLERDRQIRDFFLRFGAPKEVADYAADIRPTLMHAVIASIFVLSSILTGIAASGIALLLLGARAQNIAFDHAREIQASLAIANFGLSIIFWMFAAIFIFGTAATYLVALFPRSNVSALLFFGDSDPVTAGMLRKHFRSRVPASSPEEVLRGASQGMAKIYILISAPLVLAGAILLPLDLGAHSIASLEGYKRSTFLPWKRDFSKPWSDADYVTIACRNPDREFEYTVHFSDRTSVDLGNMKALNDNWIGEITRIDARLQETGAEFRVGDVRRACTELYRASMSLSEYDNLLALLRVEYAIMPVSTESPPDQD